MALPAAPLARGTVEVAGQMVEVRSLTRGEALEIRALAGEPDADRRGEILMIAWGTDTSPEEAEAWWRASDPVAVQKLVRGIAVVSRLLAEDGGDPKPELSARSSRASST